MAAFQFPDPTVQSTVTNPITGSTYQWQDPPGKWVVSVKLREVSDIIWEGDSPPDPIGDYKLWYSTDTLELYFYYTDPTGTSAWLPTSKPITAIDEINATVGSIQMQLAQTNTAVNENTNRIANIIYFDDQAPTIYPDEDYGETDPTTGEPVLEQSQLNYKFWLNTDTDQLHILRIDEAADNGYSYQKVSGNSDLYYGDSKPDDDKYELWYDTTRLELYVNYEGMWFPANPGSGGGTQDLQSVTEEGSMTNIPIGIQAEDGSITVVRPGQLEIQEIIKPEIRMLDIVDMDFMDIGMDENHGHISLSNPDDVLHFKFAGAEKVTFKGKGDAEFSGKVKVEPGTEENEVVTYQQLAEIEEQIEDIVPSLERGLWEFSKDGISVGQYNIFRDYTEEYCLEQWLECTADNTDDLTA